MRSRIQMIEIEKAKAEKILATKAGTGRERESEKMATGKVLRTGDKTAMMEANVMHISIVIVAAVNHSSRSHCVSMALLELQENSTFIKRSRMMHSLNWGSLGIEQFSLKSVWRSALSFSAQCISAGRV